MGIFGAIIPIVGVVARDLSNSNGLLRSLGRKLLKKSPQDEGRRVVNAPFTVINEDKNEVRQNSTPLFKE